MEAECRPSQASAQGSLDPTPPGQCSPWSTGAAWLQGVGQEESPQGDPPNRAGGSAPPREELARKLPIPGSLELASSSTRGSLPLFLHDLCCQAASY